MRLSQPRVFRDEAKSEDSIRRTTSQTATGHHRRASISRVGLSVLRRLLLDTIVGRLARDQHIMDVALAQSGAADAHETRVLLQLGNSRTSHIAHAAFH